MKNPILNGLAAGAYIAGLVIISNYFAMKKTIEEPSVFIPMVMLSLLVFSVALMGVLFFFQPLKLFMDNKREEALAFFTKTLSTFVVWVLIFVFFMFR